MRSECVGHRDNAKRERFRSIGLILRDVNADGVQPPQSARRPNNLKTHRGFLE